MSREQSKEEQELRKKGNLLHAELKARRQMVRPESLTSNDGESPDDGESVVEELNRRREERKKLKKEEERLKRRRLRRLKIFYKDKQALKLWTDAQRARRNHIQRARRNQPPPQKPSQKKTPKETSSPERKKSLETREAELRSNLQDKRDKYTRKAPKQRHHNNIKDTLRKRLDAIRKKKGNTIHQVQLKL